MYSTGSNYKSVFPKKQESVLILPKIPWDIFGSSNAAVEIQFCVFT